ncbi:MAG TPA: glycosyltransferase [Chryseosolibacter sp.]
MNTCAFGAGLERRNHNFLQRLIRSLAPRAFSKRIEELRETLLALKPDIVFIDSFTPSDAVAIAHLKGKQTEIILLQTMLSTTVRESDFPLSNVVTPGVTSSRENWSKYSRTTARQRLYDWGSVENNEKRIIKKFVRENNLSLDLDWNRQFRFGINNMNEIILSPKSLELHPGAENYLGLCVDVNRKESLSAAFETVFARFKRLKSEGHKVVYCSFGSQYLDHKVKVLKFINTILRLAALNPKYLYILSLDEKFVCNLSVPHSVIILDVVPQLEVLKWCDVMITHGGLNTVKECIYFNVPMLVVPLDKKYDQKGNASRVVMKDLGLSADFSDSEYSILRKIDKLTDPVFASNFERFIATIPNESECIDQLRKITGYVELDKIYSTANK